MEIKVQKDKKGNVENIIFTNVPLYYCMVRKPSAIYDDRKLSYDKARKEYKVTIGINEEMADQWDEIFTKQPSKKWTNKNFMENFKLEEGETDKLPCPGEKKQFTIRVTQKELKKDGTPSKQPNVFVKEDGKAVEITNDRNVGNNSVGIVKVRVIHNDYGAFAYLDKIMVTDLIEYADSDGSGLSEDELEMMGLDDSADVVKSGTKRKASDAPTDDDDDDDDNPPWEDDADDKDDY